MDGQVEKEEPREGTRVFLIGILRINSKSGTTFNTNVKNA